MVVIARFRCGMALFAVAAGTMSCLHPFCLPADLSCSPWAALIYRTSGKATAVQPVSWLTFAGGAASNEAGTIVIQTADRGYVIAGTATASFGSPIVDHSGGGTNVALVKLDSNGHQVWNTFAGGGTESVLGIVEASNGDILLAGKSGATFGSPLNPYGGVTQEGLVMRYSAQGNLIWMTFVGYNGDNDSAEAIAEASDGNIVITGWSAGNFGVPVNPFSGGVTTDAFVAKFSSSGTLLWNTFLGAVGTTQYGLAITRASGGDLYVSGVTNAAFGSPLNPYAGGQEFLLARFNSAGVLLWLTFAGSAGNDYPYGKTATTTDGGYILAGMSDSSWGSPVTGYAGGADAIVLKYSSSGALQWHTYQGTAGTDQANGVTLRADGSYCVVATSDASWGAPVAAHSGSNDIAAFALGVSGPLLWNTFYGSTAPDNGLSVAAATDGGCAFGAQAGNPFGNPVTPFAGGDDFAVVKLFADGTMQSDIP